MRLRESIAVVILILLTVIPGISGATNLRGRVVGENQFVKAPYPIVGAVVDLYIQDPRGWQRVAKYTTGLDGMYYFQNIPPGNYVLQINGKQNYPITVVSQPFQDLLPIVIRY